ncbi:ECF RNA polymerase sigma factor SigM [Sporomusa silvacetica DSM 10669]|uniref:RNA polymerase sigma factor SigZ n=1 Tax=Sporomusa silvacetica DSM 10669 TaxID=1123289 RepID=A0ABZ3IMQ9_9FIRM|nr:RNA polymerase sigma factor SigZ [Sporomusa silvacetica]OZC15728.1 RNA polymerase sigma factor SigM [Sporomusa silvacetica DSM 10669]
MNNNQDHISDEFATRLKSFISKRVSNPQDAEDILQEVYCKIYRNINGLNDTGKLHAWIFQIARNAVHDHYRTNRREEPFAEPPEPEAVRADENDNKEIAGCLKVIINHLPDKDREAIELTEYKGLTQKELGQLLGLSHSGAKSRVQRAQQRLKEMLCECCSLELDRRGNVIDYKLKAKANPFCDLK